MIAGIHQTHCYIAATYSWYLPLVIPSVQIRHGTHLQKDPAIYPTESTKIPMVQTSRQPRVFTKAPTKIPVGVIKETKKLLAKGISSQIQLLCYHFNKVYIGKYTWLCTLIKQLYYMFAFLYYCVCVNC